MITAAVVAAAGCVGAEASSTSSAPPPSLRPPALRPTSASIPARPWHSRSAWPGSLPARPSSRSARSATTGPPRRGRQVARRHRRRRRADQARRRRATTTIDMATGRPLALTTLVEQATARPPRRRSSRQHRRHHLPALRRDSAAPDADRLPHGLGHRRRADPRRAHRHGAARGWRAQPGTKRTVFVVGGRRLWRIDVTYAGRTPSARRSATAARSGSPASRTAPGAISRLRPRSRRARSPCGSVTMRIGCRSGSLPRRSSATSSWS